MGIQLSISLLASDRPAALKRCFDSLRPLLMRVPCELIVVCTGADVQIRKIAAAYTDLIVDFQWCNNFSSARNAGLKIAAGEWFLYIDDDEWFEDTDTICEFFLSGEYKRYGMACYVQRNYLDWSGVHYTDFHAVRMVKMVPGIHFQNPVHEEFVPRTGPCKYFDTYVHHYGYMSNIQKEKNGKPSRNLPILLKELKKNPSYPKNYLQAAQEYTAKGDWKKAESYCRKGIALYEKGRQKYDGYYNWMQAKIVELLYLQPDIEKADQEARSLLAKNSTCELVRLDVYTTMAVSFAKRRLSAKTLECGQKFEETLTVMEHNPDLWTEQSCGNLSELKIRHPKRLYQMRIDCVEAALDLADSSQALYFLLLLPWDKEEQMQQFYPIFDYFKSNYEEYFQILLKSFPLHSPYLFLQKAADTNAGFQERKKQLKECLAGTESDYLKQQACKEIILLQAEIAEVTDLIDMIGFDTWKQCASKIVEGIPESKLPEVQKNISALSAESPLYGLPLEKAFLEKDLIQGYLLGSELIDALSRYNRCVLEFYKNQYINEMFQRKNVCFLPKDCRFAILSSEALKKIECEDIPEALRLFQAALPLHPEMSGVFGEIIREMDESLKNPAQNSGEEFTALAGQMKNSLTALIGQSRFQEALPVVQQLSTLLPYDLELLRLRQKLFREMGQSVR